MVHVRTREMSRESVACAVALPRAPRKQHTQKTGALPVLRVTRHVRTPWELGRRLSLKGHSLSPPLTLGLEVKDLRQRVVMYLGPVHVDVRSPRGRRL
jgi:hypothetical protein